MSRKMKTNNNRQQIDFEMYAGTAPAQQEINFIPKLGRHVIPDTVRINSAFDEIQTVTMPIEELINIEPWLGNRNSEARLNDSIRRETMSGEFNSAHAIHFEVAVLTKTDVWRESKERNSTDVIVPAGTRFLVNGNTRAWAIRKGLFSSVPSHVKVNIIHLSSLKEIQNLYWKLDTKLAMETAGEVFGTIYDELGFVPKSSQYKNGAFGMALGYYGGLVNPALWSPTGFNSNDRIYPLPDEDIPRAKNRLRQEMFRCYFKEMVYNDEVRSRGKKGSAFKWDATTAIAHMLIYRCDGYKITDIHEKVLDAMISGTVRTPDCVNTPIQYMLAEIAGMGSSKQTNDNVNFMKRTHFGIPIGGAKGAIGKHLYWYKRMEKDGVIDKPTRAKHSVHSGGSMDYESYLAQFLAENKHKLSGSDPKDLYFGNKYTPKARKKKNS